MVILILLPCLAEKDRMHLWKFVLAMLLQESCSFRPGSHNGPGFGSRRLAEQTRQFGVLDSMSSFFKSRANDFVKLEDSDSAFGPGPLLLLFNFPSGINDSEIDDMLADGAPIASASFVKTIRTEKLHNVESLYSQPLGTALDLLTSMRVHNEEVKQEDLKSGTCILYFSGFSNEEVVSAYNIIASEVYAETDGTIVPACAKAVPGAIQKPLGQVIDEIVGDHTQTYGQGS